MAWLREHVLEDIFVYEYSMACVVMYVRMCLPCNRKKKTKSYNVFDREESWYYPFVEARYFHRFTKYSVIFKKSDK